VNQLTEKTAETIRRDFPLINQGKVIYLDNAATTQKPKVVIDAVVDFYENCNANIHRGVYPLSEQATAAYEGVRQKVADFIGAKSASSIVFTKNATEAINLVTCAWGESAIKEGDEIVLTEMEHHSNLVPWQILAQRKNAKLKFVTFNTETGKPNWEELPGLLTKKTKIVAFGHISNSLGTINPAQDIIKTIRAHSDAKVLIDGAQGVPHTTVDVALWDCDFLAFSAHKMLGPTGVGVLYAKEEILGAIGPFIGGGDMIKEVWLDYSRYNDVPWKFEAGTPNIAGVTVFGTALDYLNEIGQSFIRKHELSLTAYALERLGTLPGITLYGTKSAEERCGIVSFNVEGVHSHDVGTLLARENIAVRVGHHCNMPLMRKLKVPGTVRASFYIYNTKDEIDALIEAVPKVQRVFA